MKKAGGREQLTVEKGKIGKHLQDTLFRYGVYKDTGFRTFGIS